MAELTDGLIDSDESGPWESERLPATGSELFGWSLRPEMINPRSYATLDLVARRAETLKKEVEALAKE